jgi:hypothetical protein
MKVRKPDSLQHRCIDGMQNARLDIRPAGELPGYGDGATAQGIVVVGHEAREADMRGGRQLLGLSDQVD